MQGTTLKKGNKSQLVKKEHNLGSIRYKQNHRREFGPGVRKMMIGGSIQESTSQKERKGIETKPG